MGFLISTHHWTRDTCCIEKSYNAGAVPKMRDCMNNILYTISEEKLQVNSFISVDRLYEARSSLAFVLHDKILP